MQLDGQFSRCPAAVECPATSAFDQHIIANNHGIKFNYDYNKI